MKKVHGIINLGYTREEVLDMTISLPSIYGFNIENIKEKVEFYDSIGMHDLLVVNTKNLMQSVALSYARYKFYLSLGINISMDNYEKLFINNKVFEKLYGIKKEELLNRYSYEEYIESKEKVKK